MMFEHHLESMLKTAAYAVGTLFLIMLGTAVLLAIKELWALL